MAQKRVSEVQVGVNDLALSLLGWEVQDFRARVTTEEYEDGDCFHKLAVSGVLRFNNDDWTDCFSSREYPSSPVMVMRSPSLSTMPAVSELYAETPTNGRPVRISENDWFVSSHRPIDHSDLRIELTGYDSVDIDRGISHIPLDVKMIPIELVDASTPSSVRLTFDQMDAFTHQASSDDPSARFGHLRVAGRATFGSPEELLADWVSTWRGPVTKAPTVMDKAPFDRPTPNLVFDVLDDTGFLLEQIQGDISIYIPVDADGRTPSRAPRWLVDHEFEPDEYSAPVGRIIARLEDY